MQDALEARWKRRDRGNVIFCGPEDVDRFDSGATVYATDEDYARYTAFETHAGNVLSKAATELAHQLNGLDFDEILNTLSRFRWVLRSRITEVRDIEFAKTAKADLRKLSEKSFELAALMLNMGPGAMEVLNRNHVRIGEGWPGKPPRRSVIRFEDWRESWKEGAPLPENRSEEMPDEMSSIVSAGLVEDAEPFNLPEAIPFEPDEHEEEDGKYEYEWSLGGPWIVRLSALGELASKKADHLEKKTGKGGRKSLGSRLYGSPEDWLAQACKEFAEAHGCMTQSVALRMVQAVMESVHGKDTMKKLDGKPSERGRKAVRKVVQTPRKNGTV